eukprot:GHVR01033819.1.p1 GENE.GHVR01033819.1~~GHVR01033819.1.p1  ORF type:complete len:316 (+),score=52.77 GHVR01033819.1:79-1026(+)
MKVCPVLVFISYALKLIITYHCYYGYIGDYTLEEQSENYLNILTPDPIVHNIWMLIYILELVFILNLFTKNNEIYINKKEITLWWIIKCIFESVSVLAICYDYIILSVATTTFLWASCYVFYMYALQFKASIVTINNNIDRTKITNYLIFYYPAAVHMAWTTMVLVQSWNTLSAYLQPGTQGLLCQFTTAIVSLCVISSFGAVCSLSDNPDPIVALVVTWLCVCVCASLKIDNHINNFDYGSSKIMIFPVFHVCMLLTFTFFMFFINSLCVCVYRLFVKPHTPTHAHTQTTLYDLRVPSDMATQPDTSRPIQVYV